MPRTLDNPNTKFVVGVHSSGIIYYETESLEEAIGLRSESSHYGVCIYTREEWLR